MQNELFDKLEMMEQVPTELMTEVSEPKKASTLTGAADHTEIKVEDTFNKANDQPSAFQFSENQNGQQRTQPQPQPQQINAANLINGQMAVHFLDMLLPVICVLLIEKVNGMKVNKKYLQATPDEKKILEPVLHNYLASINFNVDTPLNALLITVAFIYGTKTVEVLNNVPQFPVQGQRANPFPAPTKKETRGRHKKDCQCPICKQKRK